ncbi:hypothetical protein [Paenibacillus soyae]|uniref:Uncharacterized protein n=1 Tax=Paenibacillus soyae TaxID=2969249 RepID=A0A9X2MLF8_9BACL|nr:hypothetical protein [Paenibacillus soyae]MCR2802274.1 hypothetical protein [Paenibacillus soyae]
MEQIYPLREDVISRFTGALVCVIYKNGFRQIAILNGCRGGYIELGENPFDRRMRPFWHADPSLEKSNAEPETAKTSEPAKKTASRKGKSVKAASRQNKPSPTNYAASPRNPALSASSEASASTQKIALDDILFLVHLT